MTSTVSSLTELRRFPKPEQLPPWHLHIVQRELNGGSTGDADLDILDERPEATVLTVSGLDQRSFESLVKRFGTRLTALHLWKCPRIADLSPLEAMPRVSCLAIFWNQRVERLWNFERTPRLTGLHFTDFTKLDRLDDLARAASLRSLEFGNANFSRYRIQSLEPLGRLVNLESLSFNAKDVADQRIQPLARLTQLQELDFPAVQFTVEQLAWLRARLPDTLACPALEPFRRLRQPLRRGEKQLDLLVNGKKMPFLSSSTDAGRVEKYTAAFRSRVAEFKADPDREPTEGPSGRSAR